MTTPRGRRRETSLEASARDQNSGRGWAAARGVRLAKATTVGASRPEFRPRAPRAEYPCRAEWNCNREAEPEHTWCEIHAAHARSLGVENPPREEVDR